MPFTIKKIAMRLRNDSEYIPLPGVRGEAGPGVPAGGTAGQVLAKTSNADYATRWVDAGGNASLTILSYGHSTWADFIAAYNANSIVYCRASSAADPSSGSQTRLAFMAYVNNASSPTSVEFQYYRSVSSHTDAQQGDQVFIYKLTSAGAWTVTVRDAFTKIVAGTNMSSSYANGTLTLNATGGGGGTSDYDDLTDKPSINNVTLSGNKTAAQLGLGTYSKPSGGIPATDLASAVQTSLGLADSALQSVPSTYRTAAAQDAIDAAQDEQIEAISHRNLLDNCFFVGGGSQLGYGTFPINQRGQTSYSTSGNGIDRWKASSSSMTYTVNSGGMLVKATAATQQWYQILSNQSELAGKQVTLSALTASNILIQTTVDIPSTIPSGTQTIGSGSSDVNGYALYVRTMGGKLSAVVYAGSSFSSSGIAIVAMKLEIGSNQTLAHLEGTNWVLNEIPDYGDELEKCQRYLFAVTTDAFFVGTTGVNHTNPTFFVPTPVSMVKNPTTSSSIVVNAQHGSGYVNDITVAVSSCIATPNGVRITTTGSTAIGTANYAMCLIQSKNTIYLSAES